MEQREIRLKLNTKVLQALLIIGVLLPGVLLTAVRYREMERELTASAVLRRQSVADLSASVLEEKFSHLKSLALSLSTRVRFRELVALGEWEKAVRVLRDVPQKEFPVIDRVFLTDLEGVLMSDAPAAPGVRGKSFADRDWFRSVKDNPGPIISEIYRRTAEPRFNVVAVAVPVFAPSRQGEVRHAAGYLVVQVRLSTVFNWAKSIDGGAVGRVYFADKSGRVAGWKSDDPDTGDVYDGSAVPTVNDALKGGRDVRVAADPTDGKEFVVAFSPVLPDRWATFLVQSKEDAFGMRAKILRDFWIFSFVFILFNFLLALLIVRLQSSLLRHQRERALHEAEREQLELFAFVASHDLQEPINKILSFGGILSESARGSMDPDSRESLDRMLAAARRLSRILDDVRGFAAIRRNAVRAQIDLNEVLKNVIEDQKQAIGSAGVQVRFGDLAPVTGDPAQIHSLFANLISNAVKYRAKDAVPVIEVLAGRTAKHRVEVRVRDNGIGFDEKYLDRIFLPFQRLHTRGEYEGTGLGLAICQRIVSLHGGTITARSAPLKGAEFIFSLPAGKS